jgi:hypothetical protein
MIPRIDQHQAFEYEIGKATFLQLFIYSKFPKYCAWLCKQRYKRYLGHIEMMRIEDEIRVKRAETLSNMVLKNKYD